MLNFKLITKKNPTKRRVKSFKVCSQIFERYSHIDNKFYTSITYRYHINGISVNEIVNYQTLVD